MENLINRACGPHSPPTRTGCWRPVTPGAHAMRNEMRDPSKEGVLQLRERVTGPLGGKELALRLQ